VRSWCIVVVDCFSNFVLLCLVWWFYDRSVTRFWPQIEGQSIAPSLVVLQDSAPTTAAAGEGSWLSGLQAQFNLYLRNCILSTTSNMLLTNTKRTGIHRRPTSVPFCTPLPHLAGFLSCQNDVCCILCLLCFNESMITIAPFTHRCAPCSRVTVGRWVCACEQAIMLPPPQPQYVRI